MNSEIVFNTVLKLSYLSSPRYWPAACPHWRDAWARNSELSEQKRSPSRSPGPPWSPRGTQSADPSCNYSRIWNKEISPIHSISPSTAALWNQYESDSRDVQSYKRSKRQIRNSRFIPRLSPSFSNARASLAGALTLQEVLALSQVGAWRHLVVHTSTTWWILLHLFERFSTFKVLGDPYPDAKTPNISAVFNTV